MANIRPCPRTIHTTFDDRYKTSGHYFAVFPSTMRDEEIRDAWDAMGGDEAGYRCSHEHDCCACLLTWRLSIQRVGRRALAVQIWGLNI